MKMLSTILASLLLATTANASELSCFSKFFSNWHLPVKMTALIKSETLLSKLTLTIEDEVAREITATAGAPYKSTKYPKMLKFDLPTSPSRANAGWNSTRMTLLVPQGFSQLASGSRLKVIVTEQASDGGTYNELLCQIK